MLFDRYCEVTITNTQTKTITDLRISFEVQKSIIAKDNMIKIDIYNLSTESHRMICQKDTEVRLRVGYKQNVISNIAIGDITKVSISYDKTDKVTTIYASEGVNTIKYNYISLSVTSRASLKQLTDIISSQANVQFSFKDIDASKTTQGKYVDIGSLDSVLDALSTYFSFSWSFQNGVILIKGYQQQNNTAIMLLSSDTGLLLNPESQKRLVRTIEKDKQNADNNNIVLNSLLLPQLQIHDLIEVQSRTVSGIFKINKLTHTGDTHNTQWFSKIEIINKDDTSEYL